MTDREIVELTIIFDGVREYSSNEILNDKLLYSFVTRNLIRCPASLLTQIKNENGNLIMWTNQNFDTLSFDLRNVSQELYTLFFERYKTDIL